MLTFLRICLLAVHLTLVDLAMFGPLAAFWLLWRARRGDELASGIGRRMAGFSLAALVLAGALGVLLLVCLWGMGRGAYLDRLRHLPDGRLWFALVELLFSLGCLAAIFGLWKRLERRPWLAGLLALAGSSNLAYHFPPLFAILDLVDQQGEWSELVLDGATIRRLLLEGPVIARCLHVWLAAVAVSWVAVVWLAVQSGRARVSSRAALVALVATVGQLPVGLWVALALPPEARQRLFGGDLASSVALGVGILTALRLMHALSAIARGDHSVRQARQAVYTTLLTIFSMTAALVLSGG